MSRIVEFTAYGPPEVLAFREVPDPPPPAGEVRIRVRAIGLNRAESMWRRGEYIEPVKLPARLGYEAAGIVDALGSGFTQFAVGDAVNVIPSFSMNDYGTYGDLVCVPASAVVRQPESLSFEQAASIWMMFVTAYSALVEDAAIGVGDFVVISAASSSVGLAAIQIANYAGATPIALTRTSAKADQLREVGATHVVATQETDLVQEITRITDGKGARIAFDPIGGPDFPKLLAALAFKGTAYLYGALAEGITPLPVLDMIAKMPIIKGHNIWITSGDPDRLATAVAYIRQGFAEGKLKAVIDRVFSFDDIVAAHHYLETNGQFGKIVVTL
jgi:NADPH:quinone reductase-like Zn-dependent oxidoreductase